jgi:hypothetical protein
VFIRPGTGGVGPEEECWVKMGGAIDFTRARNALDVAHRLQLRDAAQFPWPFIAAKISSLPLYLSFALIASCDIFGSEACTIFV